MSTARRARIADQIQRELAELIRLDVRDPRVRFATVTAVELSGDQSHAKVFFTVLGPGTDRDAALEGLQRAAGFLRTSLAHRLSTRTVPELHFTYDESIERGLRLSRLIDEAVKPDGGLPAEGGGDDEGEGAQSRPGEGGGRPGEGRGPIHRRPASRRRRGPS